MNPLNRTIENIVSTDCIGISADTVKGKNLYQIVKYVTGKQRSDHTDYNVEQLDKYYGFDSYAVSGKRGFIRVTLEPLFQVI